MDKIKGNELQDSKFDRHCLNFLKRLELKKFCFIFSLKTGIKVYGLSSFIIGVIITIAMINYIVEQQPRIVSKDQSVRDLICGRHVPRRAYIFYGHAQKTWKGRRLENHYNSIDADIYTEFSTKVGFWECFVIKTIVIQQSFLAFASVILLWFCGKSAIPLWWVGCKTAVGVMELTYLPQWSQLIMLRAFNCHLHSAWFTATITVTNIYGILLFLGYFKERISNKGSHTFSKDYAETNYDL